MKRLRIDDTGVICDTAKELAETIGCAQSLINYCRKHHSDSKNHFWIWDYGITVIQEKKPPYYQTPEGRAHKKAYREKYYQEHRDRCLELVRQWRKNNPERRKELRTKWRLEHRDWWNAYYRKWRKKRKQSKEV